MATIRELIVGALEADPVLQGLGLVPGAVYQAETAHSPTERPFITVRWGESEKGVGPYKRKPFTVWVHDVPGDMTRAEAMARRAGFILSKLESLPLDGGYWLMAIHDEGTGGDFADDGYRTLVVPGHLRAVASGL